jgi:penicillin-binding protein-related factor A (putative recombinase)
MISLFSLTALVIVICFFIALIVVQNIHYYRHTRDLQNEWKLDRNYIHSIYLNNIEELNESWRIERKELLDRIQSPTFHEFKSAEIRTIKANKQEEPQIPIILE